MALVRFTHVGKASVAVNPDLVFSIESYNEGQVGAYTRIRSASDSHIDVRDTFVAVMEKLADANVSVEAPAQPGESIAEEPSDTYSAE